jgi:integrase
MAIPKFYLEKRSNTKTKEIRVNNVPIILKYSFHGERLIYYTGIRCDEKYYTQAYWKGNGKPVIKVSAPRAEYLNNQLDIIKSHLSAAENEAKAAGIPLSAEYLRTYLDSRLKEKPTIDNHITLFKYFDRFIEAKKTGFTRLGHPLSKANSEKYLAVKNMLIEFSKRRGTEVDFGDFDEQLYNELVSYMITVKKYALNTYGRHIKFIKTVLHKATSDGINTNIKFQKAFVGSSELSENVYLTESDLTQIYNHDFSPNPRLERVRDVFIIGCWTGLRFSDYTNIHKENIICNRLKLVTQKTKQIVLIPLHSSVKAILEKYNYELPPAISNQKFNDYIQEVCKACEINEQYSKRLTRAGKAEIIVGEKWEFISSHTARRSFATNWYKRGMPTMLIMAITGHKTEKEFKKYIKVTPEEQAELFEKFANNWQPDSTTL